MAQVIGLVQNVATLAACCALAACAFACTVSAQNRSATRTGRIGTERLSGPVGLGFSLALLFGAASAVTHAVLMAVRLIQVGAEIVFGHPWRPWIQDWAGAQGVPSLLVLIAAAAAAWRVRRDPRMPACTLWLSVLLVTWTVLLSPANRPNGVGGFERTGVVLVLLCGYSAILGFGALATSRGASLGVDDSAASHSPYPGLRLSFIVLASAVGLLAWSQLLIPLRAESGLAAVSGIGIPAALLLSALACGSLIESGMRTAGMVDVVLGLCSLAAASVVALLPPLERFSLADGYPAMFNALVLGFSISAMACALLSLHVKESSSSRGANSLVVMLGAQAARFVFLNGVLAFLSAMMMAVWPRIPGIAAMDDSIGRVIAGLGANLALLLAMLWCSRKLNRIPLHVMTILVLCSAVGFLAARVIPFASHVN